MVTVEPLTVIEPRVIRTALGQFEVGVGVAVALLVTGVVAVVLTAAELVTAELVATVLRPAAAGAGLCPAMSAVAPAVPKIEKAAMDTGLTIVIAATRRSAECRNLHSVWRMVLIHVPPGPPDLDVVLTSSGRNHGEPHLVQTEEAIK
jgi:hypothetical protein